ncbi:uncharacterized protein [Clytia hemisphaerica]|uniref:uncharacterized protein n=1 Tax=Clytia hemisphaerica TaxID=252671 RepID=UPI0034D6F750
MATGTLEQCLRKLAPRTIDPTKCTPATSIYQELSKPPETQQRLDHQAKQWFNLGNSQTFNDPISAAEYLLEREYGDSFLFKPDCHKPIFIPSKFMSNQYCKKSNMAVFDFDIEQKIKETLVNLKNESPDFWFTKELDVFLQTQQMNDEINQKEFNNWILKIKTMHLMLQEVQVENLPENLPSTTPADFVKDCLNQLKSSAPTSNLIKCFTSSKHFKIISREAQKSPPQDCRLKWFLDLNIADRGENVERSLIDQLYSLKGSDILKETVILSSVNFLTELTGKQHQEFDFLLLSWTRKLIIGIEAKRQLSDAKAFEQLDKYHSIFEKKLSDQLGPGWSFYPVVYVEKVDTSLPPSNHYINTKTDIKTWLSTVMHLFPENLNVQSMEQLKKVLQIIVFTIHISKKDQPRPITSSYWVDYVSDVIDSLSNAHNIIFYSQQQLPLMCSDNPKYNKVFFMAGYGTGKTFLLEQKAIMLSRSDGYKDGVYYVVCNEQSLLYHERKLELGKYGIHVIYDVEKLIGKIIPEELSRVKAIFFDEWDGYKQSSSRRQDLGKRLIKEVPICWIAPNSLYRSKYSTPSIKKELGDEFVLVKLALNLRNTKEICNKAMSVADQTLFQYANGLTKPPPNFPNGLSLYYAESFSEAISRVRLKTKKGILVVSENTKVKLKTKVKVKFYHDHQSDFYSTQNPVDFLNQGNILITSPNLLSGFEWPVIIYFKCFDLDEDNSIESHECNIISRCTSLLYVIGMEDALLKSYPFTEISSLLEVTISDGAPLSNFKDLMRKYIDDYSNRYRQRNEMLRDLLPILKTTIENISQAKDKTIPFSMLKDLFKILLTELWSKNEKSGLLVPCAILNISNSFDFNELQKYLDINYYLSVDCIKDIFSEVRIWSVNTVKEDFWNYFEIDSFSKFLQPVISVLKTQRSDSVKLKQFKFCASKYIIDHLNRFNRYLWIQDLLPILKTTIEKISHALDEIGR